MRKYSLRARFVRCNFHWSKTCENITMVILEGLQLNLTNSAYIRTLINTVRNAKMRVDSTLLLYYFWSSILERLCLWCSQFIYNTYVIVKQSILFCENYFMTGSFSLLITAVWQAQWLIACTYFSHISVINNAYCTEKRIGKWA